MGLGVFSGVAEAGGNRDRLMGQVDLPGGARLTDITPVNAMILAFKFSKPDDLD